MSFSEVYSNISANRKQFSQWEMQDEEKREKRKEYVKQNGLTQDEFEKASSYRDTIINAINVMDTKSENVSESVEMGLNIAHGIVSQILSLLLIGGIVSFCGFKQAAKFEKAHKDLQSHIQTKYADKMDDYLKLINTSNIKYDKILKLDEKNDTELSRLVKDAQKVAGNQKRLVVVAALAGLIPTFILNCIYNIISAKSEVKASNIARYQARNEDLKDPKVFVEYTREQKEQAQKLIKEGKVYLENGDEDKYEFNNKFSLVTDTFTLLREASKAKEDSDNLNNIQLREIEEKDLQRGYEKQAILNDTTKYINNKAEQYSADMETFSELTLGCTMLLSSGLGAAIGAIWDKLEKMGSKAKTGKDSAKSNKILEALDPIWQYIKNNKKLVCGSVAVISLSILVENITTSLTKNAACAGRYKAKKELESDISNFVYIDDAKLNDIKVEQSKKDNGIIEFLKNIPVMIKDIVDYNKEKNSTERALMQKALSKVEVSDQQLEEAKSLQKRIFKTFDTIDDKSQEYSEDVECTIAITKTLADTVKNVIGVLPMLLLLSPKFKNKAGSIISDLISKNKEKSTKLFSSISNNIKENIDNVVKKVKKNTSYDSKKAKEFQQKINLNKYSNENDEYSKLLSIYNNLKGVLGDINKDSLRKYLKSQDIKEENIDKLLGSIDENLLSELKNSLLKSLKENPYEMCIAIKDMSKLDKIKLFISEDSKKYVYTILALLIAAGVTTNIGIEAMLCDFEKKAGKIGVQIAIKDLEKQNEETLKQS